MSEVRDLIQQLVDSGVDPIDAAEVITRAVILGAASAPKAKSAGAVRQERYRRNTEVKRLPDKEWYPLVGKVVRRDGGKCYYCGETGNLGADHVLPLSRGGTNDIENLVACCERCNKSKGGRTVEEWKNGNSVRHGRVTVTESDVCDADDKEKAPTPPKETTPPKPPKGGISPQGELEVVLDAERARAVVQHRQRLRKPLTPHAAKLLATKLAKAADPNAAADLMIERGWQGFEPDWAGNLAKGQGPLPFKPVEELTDEQRRARLGKFLNRARGTGIWLTWINGPPPGREGCRIPDDMLEPRDLRIDWMEEKAPAA